MLSKLLSDPDTGRPIDAFVRRPSPASLRRYAEEFAARCGVRMALYTFGCSLHYFYFVPETALLIAATLYGVEAMRLVEVRALRRGLAERRPRLAGAVTWIAPALYAIGAAVPVVATWSTPVENDAARPLAAALAMTFVFDAGFTYRSNRRGVSVQIAILAGLSVGLVIASAARTGLDPLVVLEILTLTIFAYVFSTYTIDAVRFREGRIAITDALEAANAELRGAAAENQRLALVSRHATDGIIVLGTDHRIEWTNDAYAKLSGYEAGELIGASAGVLASAGNDRERVEKVLTAMREGRPVRDEIAIRRRDGTDIWVDVAITPIRDEDGALSGFISVERDISAQKAHEAELAEARRTAEAAASSKAAFLATMSHEIRTPLNGVLGTADLLRESATGPEQALLIDTITGSGEYLMRIIDNVLESAKLDAGALAVEVEPFDPRRLAETSVELLRPVAARKGVALTLDLAADMPGSVAGDSGRVRQILLNLLGNAVKFTAEGSVAVALGIDPAPGAGLLRITVTDTGIGIPPDRLEAVFESFTQADRDTARRFGGTGLGLAISRSLARHMGGDITVRSVPGEGTTFVATIAVGAAEAGAADPPAGADGGRADPVPAPAAEPAAREGDRAPRVLVVDDNRTNRFVIEKMLAGAPYRLALAEDGPSAVEAAARLRPDLVLMDISMPGMDGFEACRAIRRHERDAALRPACILALTANGARAERRAAREAGMDGFLTKPVRKAALLEAIGAHLDERAPHAAAAAPYGTGLAAAE